ncbi:MAG TPA: sulfatase-like hydrolase/transferase [Thermodesulfobacteriota bacterium]|nr:sulfatase-like hydrolase/transferase [Thermodesulfobacteriota bacterium]
MKIREYSEKLGLLTPLAVISLTLMDFSGTAFAVSGNELEYEAKYLISSILTDRMQVLLLILTGIASILAFLPAIKGSKGYLANLKTAAILAIFVSFVLGILKSVTFVISNKYVQYEMYYLIFHSASSILTTYLLIALSALIAISLALITVNGFLGLFGAGKRVKGIIGAGLVPALLMFVIGGYWLNKTYFPAFSGLKSIIGNVIWALLCFLTGFLLGWAVIKMSKLSLYLSKLDSFRSPAGILILIILLNLITFFYQPSTKSGHPNIILISIDTLRADHLGSYGYGRDTTPNIDRFAKDAVLFTNTIAQSSWTLPSHMSMLTGLYPSGHGVMRPSSKLSDGHLTIAEILQNAGYETVAFTDGAYLSHRFGYQGFDHFDDIGYGIEAIYAKAVNWLKKGHSRPFFLFLHTYQVHAPYDPPPAYDIYSDKNYGGIVEVSGNSNDYYKEIKPLMTLEDYHYVIDKYDGEIYYTDYYLGKLFNKLKELNLYDDSIIILTSDHGENFLDHPAYHIDHKELYDEIVKVPLIIKAPMFPTNQIITTQVESIDIMPTVLEKLGISLPNWIDGKSVVELVQKGTYGKTHAFSERNYRYKMIRSNDWKLIHRSDTELELFDLKNDPGEQENLIAEKSSIAKPLYENLGFWMDIQKEKSKLFTADKIELDGELTQKLKALGYVN